jgi:hypothetical protein
MKKAAISILAIMLCGSFALGAVGDLTFMKKPPASRTNSRLYVSRFTHGGADKARGLVSAHSVVGQLRGALGVTVAVDATKADATKPDVIRLDFAGKGDFRKAPTAAIKMRPQQGNTTIGNIGPAIVLVKRDGGSVPATVSGTYWKQGDRRGLSLMMSVAAEGSCKFGAKTYPVRVIDGNGNLKLSDALKPPFRPSSVMPFDRVLVGTDGGKFSSSAATSYVGQPIFVDGKLYTVDVSDMKIKAAVMSVAGGKVKVDAPRWNCSLIGKKYFVSLTGGKAPIVVPPDEYVTANYTVYTGADPRKRCASIRGYGSYRGGKAFTVAAGQTVTMQLGAPIEATVMASVRSGKARINLMMKDPLGGRISGIINDAGKRPDPPTIEVINKAGKIVYTAKLAYG